MARGLFALHVTKVAVACVGLAGCGVLGGSPAQGNSQGDVHVVASTTILGSIADQVVTCAGGQTLTLMPVGADPHDYAPSSAEVAAMVNATLVITNGLGLEEGLSSAIGTAKQDGATVLEVGPLLDPAPLAGTTDSPDPHVWLDMSRMATAATLIGNELASLTGDDTYATCGAEVSADISDTDAQVAQLLSTVPASARILVTDHDAFGYFSRAYGYTVAGVVIPGGSTLSQPSSAELADLADTVRASGVHAIFANTSNPTVLIDALAQESGTKIAVVELYVGSLGPEGSGAETYQTMMLTDAQRVADALGN